MLTAILGPLPALRQPLLIQELVEAVGALFRQRVCRLGLAVGAEVAVDAAAGAGEEMKKLVREVARGGWG